MKPTVSTRNEITMIKTKISEIETEETIEKINEIKSFENIKLTHLYLEFQEKRENSNKIRNE